MNILLLSLLLLMFVTFVLNKRQAKSGKSPEKITLFKGESKNASENFHLMSGIVTVGLLLLMVVLVRSGVI